MAYGDNGEHSVYIDLRKNRQNVKESRHESHYTGTSGLVYEQGKHYNEHSNITNK